MAQTSDSTCLLGVSQHSQQRAVVTFRCQPEKNKFLQNIRANTEFCAIFSATPDHRLTLFLQLLGATSQVWCAMGKRRLRRAGLVEGTTQTYIWKD
jgi:hypothetical protein